MSKEIKETKELEKILASFKTDLPNIGDGKSRENLKYILLQGYRPTRHFCKPYRNDGTDWEIFSHKSTADVCIYHYANDKVMAHKNFDCLGERIK